MAANDYIIVAPNRRGVSGFGQAWQEQISGDYHGKSMQDYLTAIDENGERTFIDETKLGAVGVRCRRLCHFTGRYPRGPFSAFIAHDGIFNEEGPIPRNRGNVV
ncbi:MAG: prolyl oligopeptidase family serine peptidase [Bacteroidales bacterium]